MGGSLEEIGAAESVARKLDSEDPLARRLRQRYYIPEGTIYMYGNSLGLLCRDSEGSVLRVLYEWKTLATKGWLAKRLWFYFAEELNAMYARVVGVEPDEVVLSGITTVNTHQLAHTYFRPDWKRKKIIADELDFP
jgi:kynureninase